VVQVDHLRKETGDARVITEFFAKTIGLPPLWTTNPPKQELTTAVWFGNMALYITGSGRDTGNNQPTMIALESVQHNDALVRLLDEYGVDYEAPVPIRFAPALSAPLQWSDFLLKDLSTANLPVVIADYAGKDFINEKRKEAKKILEQSNGGKLGIRLIKKIVIGSSDPQKSMHSWVSIPGVRRAEGNRFLFFSGPDIVIEPAAQDAIQELVIKVTSLQAAKDFLLEKKSLLLDRNQVLIDPAKTAGIRMVLEE
jgi:hypothetical protein